MSALGDALALAEARRAWARSTLFDRCVGAAWTVVVFVLLTGLLDPWFLPSDHHVRVALTARALAVAFIGALLVASRWRWTRPIAWPATAMAGIGLTALGAFATASLGGLDRPWVYLGYLLPVWTTPLPLSRGARALAVLTTGVTWWATVQLVQPTSWSSPWMGTVAGTMAFTMVLHGWLGDKLWQSEQARFDDSWRLRRSQERLTALNATLTERVAARTAEVRDTLRRLEASREEERTAIAGLLHDELGQELTALRLHVCTRLADQPHHAADLDRRLDEVQAAAQRLLLRLRPRFLETFGLREAVHRLVERVVVPAGLVPQVTLADGVDELPDGLALDVFRTLQEGVTNIVRHAGASQVWIDATTDAERLTLIVEDDGVGLSQRGPSPGFGLVGIDDRTAARGGTVHWGPGRAGGTRLTVVVPRGLEVPA